jgi:hypothetical protein
MASQARPANLNLCAGQAAAGCVKRVLLLAVVTAARRRSRAMMGMGVKLLPRPLKIPSIPTLKTLADVRERHKKSPSRKAGAKCYALPIVRRAPQGEGKGTAANDLARLSDSPAQQIDSNTLEAHHPVRPDAAHRTRAILGDGKASARSLVVGASCRQPAARAVA